MSVSFLRSASLLAIVSLMVSFMTSLMTSVTETALSVLEDVSSVLSKLTKELSSIIQPPILPAFAIIVPDKTALVSSSVSDFFF